MILGFACREGIHIRGCMIFIFWKDNQPSGSENLTLEVINIYSSLCQVGKLTKHRNRNIAYLADPPCNLTLPTFKTSASLWFDYHCREVNIFPPFEGIFEDDVHFPKVGYVIVPWGNMWFPLRAWKGAQSQPQHERLAEKNSWFFS